MISKNICISTYQQLYFTDGSVDPARFSLQEAQQFLELCKRRNIKIDMCENHERGCRVRTFVPLLQYHSKLCCYKQAAKLCVRGRIVLNTVSRKFKVFLNEPFKDIDALIKYKEDMKLLKFSFTKKESGRTRKFKIKLYNHNSSKSISCGTVRSEEVLVVNAEEILDNNKILNYKIRMIK